MINDIATNGHSYLNAILSITMVAQGGAVLAVFLKSKDKHLKEDLTGSCNFILLWCYRAGAIRGQLEIQTGLCRC